MPFHEGTMVLWYILWYCFLCSYAQASVFCEFRLHESKARLKLSCDSHNWIKKCLEFQLNWIAPKTDTVAMETAECTSSEWWIPKALLCTQEAERTSFIHTKPNSRDFVCLLPGFEIRELRGRTKWTTSLESKSRGGHMPRWTSSHVEKSHMQAWKRAGVLQLLNIVHHYHFQEGHAHKLQASESRDEWPRRWTKKSFSGQSHRTKDEKHFQPAHRLDLWLWSWRDGPWRGTEKKGNHCENDRTERAFQSSAIQTQLHWRTP